MARIKIEDLPVKEEMSEQELKGVFGGTGIIITRQQEVRQTSLLQLSRANRGLKHEAAKNAVNNIR